MNKTLVPLLILLLVIASGSSFYFYNQNQKLNKEIQKLKLDPNKVAQKEAEDLIAKVRKLYDLPKDEKPTIATIADKSKIDVKTQPFFTNAQNGDRVLLYVKAKKAILYREKANKIIEVGTLNVQQSQQNQQNTQTVPQPTSK